MHTIMKCAYDHNMHGGAKMPRNPKCRRVCAEPENKRFTPEFSNGEKIEITIEELEAIRLCDLEGLDQNEAAEQMNISRGTLQRILYSARQKSASALVQGMEIVICGGNYQVEQACCRQKNPCRHCRFMD